MRSIALIMMFSAICLSCAGTVRRHTVLSSGEGASLFVKDDDGLMGCSEVGLVAETDGALQVSAKCSCEHPEREEGTEVGALRRLGIAARDMGANAVWVLKVHQQEGLVTHNECCYVSGFRVYGVAFKCDEGHLAWHRKHEELAHK